MPKILGHVRKFIVHAYFAGRHQRNVVVVANAYFYDRPLWKSHSAGFSSEIVFHNDIIKRIGTCLATVSPCPSCPSWLLPQLQTSQNASAMEGAG